MQKLSKTPAFMMHMVAGYPSMESSERIAHKILETADLLEIQIPFSDPIADGPVIASANEAAIKNGTTVKGSLEMIGRIASSTPKPVLIMTYLNIIHSYGIEAFCKKAKKLGVSGLIVPDYPFDEEEGNELIKNCQQNELDLIQVIASNTRPERMNEILKKVTGFVYCMARAGTTGKKTEINSEVLNYLEKVRDLCPVPLAVGFGISEKTQVEALKNHADIIVVGSALIRQYQNKPLEEGLMAIDHFMKKLV